MIYCAGPFFNDNQVNHAKALAARLKEFGYSYYAPVEHQFVKDGELAAQEVFDRNINEMKGSDLILAQLNYPMPDHGSLVMHLEKDGAPTHNFPVYLPDSGTVWEMGWAYAEGIPIIGYTTGTTKCINLMLAQSCKAFVEDVFVYVGPQGLQTSMEKPWEGNVL